MKDHGIGFKRRFLMRLAETVPRTNFLADIASGAELAAAGFSAAHTALQENLPAIHGMPEHAQLTARLAELVEQFAANRLSFAKILEVRGKKHLAA